MVSVDPDTSRGVFGITTAAELVGTGVQNLRLYERRGLIDPDRTNGGTRRYSRDDLEKLRRITELLAAGLNLAGIAMVLDLQDANDQLRGRLAASAEVAASRPDLAKPDKAASPPRSRVNRP